MITYLTDIEGIWQKLVTFLQDNPFLTMDDGGRLWVKPGKIFVFGGDAIDRGPDAQKIVSMFLDLKERQPEQAFFLAGNRDINKMRLYRELAGKPPKKAPPEVAAAPKPELLRWIFANSMNAKDAFSHRQRELAKEQKPSSDEDVVRSFLDDISDSGDLHRYLAQCQLAYRFGETLFVHGGVTPENLGVVPESNEAPLQDIDLWVERLNAWYRSQIQAFTEKRLTDDGEPAWQPVINYQAPLPGTRVNQQSVIYSRLTDELGNPHLPEESVRERLRQNNIKRVVLGHTPSGDSPSVLKDKDFEMIMADNSYGRVDFGSRLVLEGDKTSLAAAAKLDSKEEVKVSSSLSLSDVEGPIGLRDQDSGHLVKGLLEDGSYLLFKALEGYAIEQVRCSAKDLAKRRLEPPEAKGTPYR